MNFEFEKKEKEKIVIDIEKKLISCLIAKPTLYSHIKFLIPEYFIGKATRQVFTDIVRIIKQGEKPTYKVLAANNYGVFDYAVSDDEPDTDNAIEYAKFIERQGKLRLFRWLGQKLIEKSEKEVSPGILKNFVTAKLLKNYTQETQTKDIEEHFYEVREMKQRELENPSMRMFTGWKAFDDITNGLVKGRIFGIAGGSGVGKSLIAESLVLHFAKQGHTCYFASLEMSNDIIIERAAQMLLGNITKKEVAKAIAENKKLENEIKKLAGKIKINTTHGLTFMDIVEDVKYTELRTGQKIDVLFVDYLQLIKNEKSGIEKLEEITNQMIEYAHKLDVLLIPLIQTNRNREAGNHNTVIIRQSDLYGSSTIEKMCEYIIGFASSMDLQSSNKLTGVDKFIFDMQQMAKTTLLCGTILKGRSGGQGVNLIFSLKGDFLQFKCIGVWDGKTNTVVKK